MPEIDLNLLDLAELKKLHRTVGKAIETYEQRRKAAALAELESKVRELGFSSLAELYGGSVKASRKGSAPKFGNPNNPDDTWSGMGRKPRWYTDALAAGKTAEDLAI